MACSPPGFTLCRFGTERINPAVRIDSLVGHSGKLILEQVIRLLSSRSSLAICAGGFLVHGAGKECGNSTRRPDGSVDSFRSSRNRSLWQYATFIAALCHDLGKLFDLEVRGKSQTWCPLHEPYDEFGRRTKTPVASWRPDRQYGAHAWSSLALLHHVLSCEDVAYLGAPRLWHLFASLAEGHGTRTASPLTQTVSRADQASVEQAQPAKKRQSVLHKCF